MNKLANIRFAPLGNSIYIKPFKMIYEQNGVEKSWDMMEIHDSVAIVIYNITRKVLVFVKQFRPGVYYSKINPEDRNKTINTDAYPAELGMTIELCAGIKDKNKSLIEIAQEEVIEETGYKVPLENFEKIHSYNKAIAISSSTMSIYYCEVSDSMKIKNMVKKDDSEVVEMSLDQFHTYMKRTVLPCSTLLLITYYCASVGISGTVVSLFYCQVSDDMKVSKGGGIGDEIIEVVEMSIDKTMDFLKKDVVPSPGSLITGIYWFLMYKLNKNC